MADSLPPADRQDDAIVKPDGQPAAAYPGMPRWVKIVGTIALIFVLLVGIMHLTGYAPTRHTLPAEHGVQQP